MRLSKKMAVRVIASAALGLVLIIIVNLCMGRY